MNQINQKRKVLILRFSSFGDVTQCLSVAGVLGPWANEVHWAIRVDLAPLAQSHPHVTRVWPLDRRDGILGLWNFFVLLRSQNFTHIYDAHNSLRSIFLYLGLLLFPTFKSLMGPKRFFLKRPIHRLNRWLLVKFKINRMAPDWTAQKDLLAPLESWGLPTQIPPAPQLILDIISIDVVTKELEKYKLTKFIALCPSAAYELKRWPLKNWAQLITFLPNHDFVILGGPQDKFLTELVSVDPNRVYNFSGRLSLLESAALIERADLTVTNDTGLLHVAEQLGKPTIALMGPAHFGRPSRISTTILEKTLPCRPCSKHGQGPCTNPNYQQCLTLITPEEVVTTVKIKLLSPLGELKNEQS